MPRLRRAPLLPIKSWPKKGCVACLDRGAALCAQVDCNFPRSAGLFSRAFKLENDSSARRSNAMLLRIVLMWVALCVGGSAQSIADGLDPNSATYKQIKALDAKIFDAYNTCDLTTLADMVDDNLEFYHDRTGLSVGKASFINAIKNNICHKVRRELVASSLEVYPLQDYGAIELGQHTFCNMAETPACKDDTNGIGKFFMLWQKQGDQYRLTRVVSYDHLSDRQRRALHPH
jgi:hypothetical protein